MTVVRLVPILVPFLASTAPARAADAALELRVREEGRESSGFLPSRVHLEGPGGEPVRAPGLPFFHDHFSFEGSVDLALAAGRYRYTVARGPEYREASGTVELRAGTTVRLDIALERWIDLARRGWYAGETHVHRPLDDVPLLLRSEDLRVAPVLTQWNRRNLWEDRPLPEDLVVEFEPGRFYHALACEDERAGGALFYIDLRRPLALRGDTWEYPSPVKHLREALAEPGVRVEIEKPFWWDTPTWLATGEVQAIGLANNHMCRSRMLENEAWGRPRDEKRLPAPRGNGFFTQELYYRILDCGFRIAPTAGSASGVLPNPVGYNRVYVHVAGDLSYEAWNRGLVRGRSFVTNGPVLLVEANGKLPGEVFRTEEGEAFEAALDVRVDGNDPLEAVEVVRDGEVVERIEDADPGGWLRPSPLLFEESGWFLVRAIARVPETFRFASTAPFWVERPAAPRRIDPEDVRFFLDWIDERIERIREGRGTGGRRERLTDPEKTEEVLAPHREAREYFEELLEKATVPEEG